MRTTVAKRVADLCSTLREASEAHRLGQSIYSDEEYDTLMDELHMLETEFPDMRSADSPTNQIGFGNSPSEPTTRHKTIMPSLKKVSTLDDLDIWARKQEGPYSVWWKFDGIALSVIYKHGSLVAAKTRGNGWVGQNVLQHVPSIENLPQYIPLERSRPYLEVRGEVVISWPRFNNLDTEYKTPRNLVAGLMNRKSGDDSLYYSLRFKQYAVSAPQSDEIIYAPHDAFMDLSLHLSSLDKMVGTEIHTIAELLDIVQGIDRNPIDYPIDGLVIHGCPEPAVSEDQSKVIAFKFSNEKFHTQLIDVIWQVGKTGRLNPVGILKPVSIGNVTIQRATLNNMNYIQTHNIHINDIVRVERAGDVIPKIVSVEKKTDSRREIEYPRFCKECYHQPDGGYCVNKLCVGRLTRMILHWCSEDCLDIKGVGPAYAKSLVEKFGIRRISDLYFLNKECFYINDVPRSAADEMFYERLEMSKSKTLDKVLAGLGIPGVGPALARKIAKHFDNIDNLLRADTFTLSSVPGIGNIIADNIVTFLAAPEMQECLRELDLVGPRMEMPTGKEFSFVFAVTGTLSRPRPAVVDLIHIHGHEFSKTVTKRTDLLVVGDKPGKTKIEKASRYKVKQISEETFNKLLEAANA